MDWNRAKTILIAITLALNIALALVIFSGLAGGGIDERIFRDVEKILSDRGVTVSGSFPKTDSALPLIAYDASASPAASIAAEIAGRAGVEISDDGREAGVRVALIDGESLAYRDYREEPLFDGFSTDDDRALDAALRATFEDIGFDMESFRLDTIDRPNADAGGVSVRYEQVFMGQIVFDGYIMARLTRAGGISSVDARARGVRATPDDREITVAPAYQIALRYYTQAGQAIESMDIGYLWQSDQADSEYEESEGGPVWRVRLANGSERYFEALYGDEITVSLPDALIPMSSPE